MTPTPDIWQTTAVSQSGARPQTDAGAAVEFRADILAMTQVAEDAVLRPADPGGWPHALRAALASRISHLNAAPGLASRYHAMIEHDQYAPISDPDRPNLDASLDACLAFTDRVATRPHDITADDVAHLQRAGVSDADIVRLCELNAFLAYQIRLVAGLSLLTEAGA